MAVSNEEVEAAQQRVAKLREQLAQEVEKRTTRESDLANELALKQLEREEAVLQGQLLAEKASAPSAKELRDSGPLATVSEQAKVAAQQAKDAEKAAEAPKNNEKQEG